MKAKSNPEPKSTHFINDLLSFFTSKSKEDYDKEKKTLVLDLDETLVHSSCENPSKGYDFNVSTVVSGAISKLYVKKRPGLDRFLEEMSHYYEIYTYTSSMKEYSDQIIENIDPKNTFIKRSLCRHNCVYANGVYIKDLSKLKKKLKDIIIVDNSKNAFLLHKPNGILISAFYDDPNDRELKKMMQFLKFLSNVYDLRPAEDWKKSFNGSVKIEYLDSKKVKQIYINEVSPKSIKEESNMLCSFASLKKDIERLPFEEDDFENDELKMKDNGNLANLARSKSKETEDGGNSKPRNNKPEITNNFMKVKKDFLEKKSKLLKKDQKQMMVMHDI